MADPFEVRMRFTNLIAHLSASATSSMKAAHYALKHRDMDEDLHSCIMENLERGTSAQNNATVMNNRANVMYFLEHFCDAALREGHQPYVDFVKRDIKRIVDSVAASGANVKVVRKVVSELGTKGVLDDTSVKRIEDDLKIKEQERGALLGDEEGGAHGQEGDTVMNDAEPSLAGGESKKSTTDNNRSAPRSGKDSKPGGMSKADKRAIEQRIEEDRERNKRLREGVWAVTGDDEQELEKMWEEGSDLNDDDYIIAGEEADERRQFARYHRSLLER